MFDVCRYSELDKYLKDKNKQHFLKFTFGTTNDRIIKIEQIMDET